ncbi:MAG: carboxypeptidase regulatory-like domain-containing protein [Mariprofundus sp.]|nr:carboxypeptidase regulatory-like domain-containing protein [Mariprofundus sp.]
MDECKYYPIFEDNQVLTAAHLNQLSNYMNGQDRSTRNSLLGVGIVCGLDISLHGLADKPELHISKGTGITSEGYLLKLAKMVLTYYRPYVDPVGYAAFQKDDDQIALWEILPSPQNLAADDSIKRLDASVLKDKAVMLYLECLDVDIGVCTGSNCDEKGRRFELCVKALLIDLSDLAWLRQQAASNNVVQQQINCRFQLPIVRMGRRLDLLAYGRDINLKHIADSYRSLIEIFIKSLVDAVLAAGQCYQLLMQADHDISLSASRLQDKIKQMMNKNDLSIQYCYDFLKDLELAYEEYRQALFALSVQCCPDSGLFPKHLMLGTLSDPVDCKPSSYRQSFLYSPILNAQQQMFERAKHLYLRIQQMIESVDMPEWQSNVTKKHSSIRITPGRERSECLGRREIPYYYSAQGLKGLSRLWDYDLCRRGEHETVLSYHRYGNKALPDFVHKPLEYNLDSYNFFRIEGHLGVQLPAAIRSVEQQIQRLNLPFKILALKLGGLSSHYDFNCRFEDIQLSYGQLRSELICLMRREIVFFANLQTIELAAELSPVKGVTGIEGMISNPSGVVIQNAKVVVSQRPNIWSGAFRRKVKQTRWEASSGSDGKYKIVNMIPGNYNLLVTADAYNSQNIPVRVSEDHVLKKDVQLRSAFKRSPFISYPIMSAVTPASFVNRGIDTAASKSAVSMEVAPAVSGTTSRARSMETASTAAVGLAASEGSTTAQTPPTSARAVTYVERGQFMGDSLTATPLLNSVGDIYKSYNESGRTEDLFTFSSQLMLEVPAQVMESNFFFHIRYPMQIIEAIEDLVASLPETIETFHADSFHAINIRLQELANQYLEQIEAKKVTGDSVDDQDLIEHLKGLLTHCSIAKFQALITVFKKRIEEIAALNNFHVYLKKHPGMEHLAGVRTGGTFLLVYDDSGSVVADFALPYICCSDCPPITICFAETKDRISFELPQTDFCKNDETSFKFMISPAGGQVEGNGTYQDRSTGEWYFKPSHADVLIGSNELKYLIDGEVYALNVLVREIEVVIDYEVIAVDHQSKKAKVKFASTPADADKYKWDFGDGTSSKLAKLQHEFDFSDTQQFIVSLFVKKGDCKDNTEEKLIFVTCSAVFKVDIKARSAGDTTAVVRFTAEMPDAEQYVWGFGDGSAKVKGQNSAIEHVYKLLDVKQKLKISLAVRKGSCNDSKTQELLIEPVRPLAPPRRAPSDPVEPILIQPSPAAPILTQPAPTEPIRARPAAVRVQSDVWLDGAISKTINTYLAELETMQTQRQFRKVFQSGDVYDQSNKYILSIADDLKSADGAEQYATGKMNDDLAAKFELLLSDSHQKVLSLARNATRQKEFAYQLTMIQTFSLLRLVSQQRLNVDGKILSTFALLLELLADLKQQGIDINPSNTLAAEITTAMKAAKNKAKLKKQLKELSQLLS